MPIIVIKSHDHSLKKKLDLVINQGKGQAALLDAPAENDIDEPDDLSPHSGVHGHGHESMEELLDFKVYRVSKPNFFDRAVKTRLIGEDVFYNEEQSHAHIADLHNTPEKVSKEQLDKPTLLQKFRAHRHTHPVRGDHSDSTSFLANIRKDDKRFKMVKAGQKLSLHVEGPTAKETFKWAVQFVHANEPGLVQLFLDVAERLKTYELHQTNSHKADDLDVLKKVPSPRAKTLGGSSASKALTQTSNDFATTATKITVSKSVSLSQQLEAMKQAGTDQFLRMVSVDARGGSPSRTSSRQTSSRQSNHSAGDPARPGQPRRSAGGPRSTGKHVRPKSAELDSGVTCESPVDRSRPESGDERAADEVASTIAEYTDEELQGQRTVEDQGLEDIPEGVEAEVEEPPHEASASVEVAVAETVDGEDEDAPEGEDAPSGAAPMAETSPAPPQSQPQLRSDPKLAGDGRRPTKMKVSAPTKPATASKHRAPRAIKTKEAPKEDKETASAREGTEPRPPEEVKPSTVTGRSPRSRSAKVRIDADSPLKATKYSSNGGATHGDVSESEGVQVYEQLKKTQELFMKSIGYTLGVFKQTAARYQAMHAKAQKKLRRIERHGGNLLVECENYAQVHRSAAQRAAQLWEEKQFNRLGDLEVKAHFFSPDAQADGLGASAAEDLKRLRALAASAKELAQVKLLHEVKWYLAAAARLREYMRRMNNNAPQCCLKMLLVMKHLLTLGFAVSVEIFHELLLSDIFLEEDFRKNIVNQVIDVVRTGLEITPEEFLAFLEAHGIQPPPDLLNEIRQLAGQKPVMGAAKRLTPTTYSTRAVAFHEEDEVRVRPVQVVVEAAVVELGSLAREGLLAADAES